MAKSAARKPMEPHDFRKWRRALGFSQRDAAEALGLKRRMIQYYERGERDGEEVRIPLYVALACYAIADGVANYRGPSKKIDWRTPPDAADETKGDGKAKSAGTKSSKEENTASSA